MTTSSALADLLPALQRLDSCLERRVAQAQQAYGPEAANDPYRGLYVSRQEVDRLLVRQPGVPPFVAAGASDAEPRSDSAPDGSALSWLVRAFGLTSFDVDVIVVALAPEIDLRYERLYAYLQDDVTRKRPTVDLALNLFCETAGEKLAERARFAAEAPLVRHRLVHVLADATTPHSPLLAHYLKLDDQIGQMLLGQTALDRRLAAFCDVVTPTATLDALCAPQHIRNLAALLRDARGTRRPLTAYMWGAPGAGRRSTAEALAHDAEMQLLRVDLGRALMLEVDLEALPVLLPRECWLHDAILCLDGFDAFRADRPRQAERLFEAMGRDSGVTIMTGSVPWQPDPRHPLAVVSLPFGMPDVAFRRTAWRACLAARNVDLPGEDADALANAFRLTIAQITDAVACASEHARLRAVAASDENEEDRSGRATLRDLRAAARAQSGHDLGKLARKIEPRYGWDDLVVPEDALAQLREICERVAYQSRVLGEWGFGRKLVTGRGINALFAGASGTGKTMAAEVIANALGLDLYAIDLSGVISKYIGETEKNLDRIFTVAENANAILFFDEADALFGKRSEVRDSHDRYANIEIAYLLQKMERYDGIAILATNLKGNLDESFTRRLAFAVYFPFPDEACRQQIWSRIWPSDVPRIGVEPARLANQFKLSGGNIRNVALAAAFRAAADGGIVTPGHVLHAVRREFQKMGKSLSDADLHLVRNDDSMGVEHPQQDHPAETPC